MNMRSIGRILRPLIAFSALMWLSSALAAEPDNGQCLRCHADSDIHAVTTANAGKKLFVSDEAYREGVHASLPCVACHQSPAGNAGFEALPHKEVATVANACESCHGVVKHDIVNAYQKSVHAQKIAQGKFSCQSCHDAHTMQSAVITQPSRAQIAATNALCTDCHTRAADYKALSGKSVTEQDLSHPQLPAAQLHLSSLRCTDCHAATGDGTLHNVAPAKESVACKQCHSESSLLAERQRFTPPASLRAGSLLGHGLFDDASLIKTLDSLGGIPAKQQVQTASAGVFADSYMVGANGSPRFDRAVFWAVGILAALLIVHGVVRLAAARANASAEWHRTYLYTLPVRVWHWLNALCFVVLLFSGAVMHFAIGDLAFWAEAHNAAGLTLCGVWLLFLLVNLTGNGHHYRVQMRGLMGRIVRQTRYYLLGIFRHEPHPQTPDESGKFNALQQLGYLCVMFLMVPLLLASGLLMLYPEYAPDMLFGLPGKQVIAWTHYGLAAAALMFLLVHLYLCTTGDTPSALIKGMIDGYHRHRGKSPDKRD